MIHKQILDKAADKPEASLNAIADEIPSASVDLVERVLEEYGDPANSQPIDSLDDEDFTTSQDLVYPEPNDLTVKQRETLHAVYKHPEASQRDIADLLNVSAPTVSNRVNSIEGFNWDDRREFAQAVFDTEDITRKEKLEQMKSNEIESKNTIDQLTARVTSLEQQVEELSGEDEMMSGSEMPELMHKVIHACMKSDHITEDEELRILKELI